MNPSASIVTVDLNGRALLAECLDALVSQDYPRDCVEIILVDNGSTDDTVEVVRGFEDPRITFVFESRRGANTARTRGEQEIRSDYVVFLDSDNRLYDNDTLRVMLEDVELAPAEAGCVASMPMRLARSSSILSHWSCF